MGTFCEVVVIYLIQSILFVHDIFYFPFLPPPCCSADELDMICAAQNTILVNSHKVSALILFFLITNRYYRRIYRWMHQLRDQPFPLMAWMESLMMHKGWG